MKKFLPLSAVAFLGLASLALTQTDDSPKAEQPSTITFKVMDTHQASCYDEIGSVITCPGTGVALYGQDAQYDGIQPSFKDNGDGTVTDLNTGLMWEKGQAKTQSPPQPDKYSWDEASAYCSQLRTGGYSDWRMPDIKELFSITTFDGKLVSGDETNSQPYIDTDYFDYTYSLRDGQISEMGQSWASTKYTGKVGPMQGTDGPFMFNFADGHIKVTKGPNLCRCVRGEGDKFVNDFVDNGDGTVTDRATGLMWQKGFAGGLNWMAALAYAENLALAGYTDWRLPDIKELQSIVDYVHYDWSTGTGAMDLRYFESPMADYSKKEVIYFWSGTTHGDNPSTALYVSFGHAMTALGFDSHGAGAVRSDPKTGDPADWTGGMGPDMPDVVSILNYVRAVRRVTGTFSLASDAGVDGGTLPADCTCDGTGASPQMSWSDAPVGTGEFALMMTTIPVDGSTKWDWVLYGIPASVSSLARNSSGVGTLGASSRGSRVYEPPCSQGPGAKLYTFTVYALSASPQLPSDPDQITGAVLTQAISGITLGSASLNLSYSRPDGPPTASFSFAPAAPVVAQAIAFTDASTGAPSSWSWDFGDGSTSALQNPTHAYASPGTYTVSLTAANAKGSHTATSTVTVAPVTSISAVGKASSPFRLKVSGSNFLPGCLVLVNGVAAPATLYKSAILVVAKGVGLSAMIPKGVSVQIVVKNPDGTQCAPFSFTR